jgi:pimeloyl-ACP methyl ester carboxylesterase
VLLLGASCSLETGATGVPAVSLPTDSNSAAPRADGAVLEAAAVPSGAAAVPSGAAAVPSAASASSTSAGKQTVGATVVGGGAASASSSSSDAGSLAPAVAGDAGRSPSSPSAAAFPAIDDPWLDGPYTATTRGTPRGATLSYPMELGDRGLHHPLVLWDNASGVVGPSVYFGTQQQLATHGFVVYAAFSSSADGGELRDGIDWLLAENARPASDLFDKLDPQQIAVVGHALGSIASFAAAADPRVTTSVHISGATNESLGRGHALLKDLHAPAAFFCDAGGGISFAYGDPTASCQWDFDHTTTPVFLATIEGGELNDMRGALVAWLRWLLLGDTSMKAMFAGGACTLCSRAGWSEVEQRDLDTLP